MSHEDDEDDEQIVNLCKMDECAVVEAKGKGKSQKGGSGCEEMVTRQGAARQEEFVRGAEDPRQGEPQDAAVRRCT